MKRLEVDLAETAIADLDDIYVYVLDQSRSAKIADGFIDRIEARCQKIGAAPHGGRRRDDLGAGLRTIAFEKTALIVYRVDGDRVVVLNVLYRGRDVDSAFADA